MTNKLEESGLMRKKSRHIIPYLSHEVLSRSQPCRICGHEQGLEVAQLDYWDLWSGTLLTCPNCRHTQLDPMLTQSQTAIGCRAYFFKESLEIPQQEIEKNYVRNFRRGVLFAYQLKWRNIQIHRILELGPGSGYFLAGMKWILPHLEIHVMDINPDVLEWNHLQHGFHTHEGTPDDPDSKPLLPFDLVIARDLIEHVSDIHSLMRNVHSYLNSGGYFHFITPNGHEDLWKHYLTRRLKGLTSELLINHVNYFDGAGLQQFIESMGFKKEKYYTYGFKTTRRGQGWKISKKLMSPVSKKQAVDHYWVENAAKDATAAKTKEEVLQAWYIQKNAPWLCLAYSAYQHGNWLSLNPAHNLGHEIFGLFRKG